MSDSADLNVVQVSHLRDHLGMAVLQVAETGEPIVVARYRRANVALVPLAEWLRLKEIAAHSRPSEDAV